MSVSDGSGSGWQKGVLPHHENMVIAVDPGELHFKRLTVSG